MKVETVYILSNLLWGVLVTEGNVSVGGMEL
jgi:hypothetical protein